MRFTIPRITRVLLALLILVSIVWQTTAAYRTGLGLNFTKSTLVPWISLTPQRSWSSPWVYVTATYAEQNLFTLGIAGAALFFGGRYLERAWGEQELAKFIALLTLVPNVVASLLYMIAYALTKSENLLNTSIQGSIAIQAGMLVSFKQLVPEHTVSVLRGTIRVRVKHFPAIFLLANTVSGFVLFTDTAAILSWLGFLVAWTYLRFYQHRPDEADAGGGVPARGDPSETFAFAYFWPDRVHAPIAAAADAVHALLVAVGLCVPFSADEVRQGTQEARLRAQGGTLPTTNPAAGGAGVNRLDNSERRKALALQALNERLAGGGGGGGGAASAPSQVRTAQQPPPPPPMAREVVGAAPAAPQASAAQDASATDGGAAEGRGRDGGFKPEWSHEQP